MFEFSRKVTYIIFYYQQFRNEDGLMGQSCYHLSRAANGGISVYLSLVCCFTFIFYIGLKLIPLYSISTHVAMHQRKLSYMHKLAKGTHKISAVQRHGHDPHQEFCSKYVVCQPTSDTNMLSDYEHMIQQYLPQSSDDESHEYDADDVLPDSMTC